MINDIQKVFFWISIETLGTEENIGAQEESDLLPLKKNALYFFLSCFSGPPKKLSFELF